MLTKQITDDTFEYYLISGAISMGVLHPEVMK
jgi:hypothetical protein